MDGQGERRKVAYVVCKDQNLDLGKMTTDLGQDVSWDRDEVTSERVGSLTGEGDHNPLRV